MSVARRGGLVVAGRPGAPEFRVRLATGDDVQNEATEIGETTPHAKAMQECDARFEIEIDDLDAALDDINTLMEVQVALQEASGGFIFRPWNDTLSEPAPG